MARTPYRELRGPGVEVVQALRAPIDLSHHPADHGDAPGADRLVLPDIILARPYAGIDGGEHGPAADPPLMDLIVEAL
jgi:hypothetical protein